MKQTAILVMVMATAAFAQTQPGSCTCSTGAESAGCAVRDRAARHSRRQTSATGENSA